MIDDEKLQELLGRASSLYNNGEYKGAIEAWQEALGVDPTSQKAREGIRMATLLLGDFDVAAAPVPEDTSAVPADGGEPVSAEAPTEEREARIDLGVARVKQLMAERKYAEAIEGAQALLPLDSESPEILRLLEEAQHAFESTPFIDEHLTLARELLSQERFSEAEAECKKVFTLDATHPGGKTLLKEIRDKIQSSLKAAASQLGGMTVKLTMPQAIAAGVKLKTAAAPPAPKADPEPIPEMYEGPDAIPGTEGPLPESGEGALAQEEVAARAALDAAFDNQTLDPKAEDSPFERAGEGPGAIGAPEPVPVKEEVVEAKTVRPPTSRVVPKAPAAAQAVPAAAAAEPPPVLSGPAKKPAEPVGAGHAPSAAPKPAAPAARPGPVPATHAAPKTTPGPAAPPGAKPAAHMPPAGPSVPVAEVAQDQTAAWETELTQLNLKDKERGLLRGTGAKPTGKPADSGEMDLMALLDGGGGMPGMPGENAAPQPASVPLAKPKETAKAKPHAATPSEAPASQESPVTATRLRQVARPRPAPARSGGGISFLKILILLVLLAAGAGAGAYFYKPEMLQPVLRRLPMGIGQPSHPVAPPAGAPAGTVDGGHAPIPTPIGGTSRQQAAAPQQDGAGIGAPGVPATSVPAGGPGGTGPAPAQTGTPAPPRAASSNEPIKPPTVPAMSKEEMQRKIVSYTADGRRLIGLGKWREARAKLNAVLALDPANIEVKELADRAQAKIDEDQRLQDEFDSTKKLYADKDYENALRKLYRLPRDKGLGDIDLYIRNSWYNWAVTLLKAGNTKDALAKLSEELTLDPDDASALKLQELAERYQNRAKDRTYYAFSDGLTLRPFDSR